MSVNHTLDHLDIDTAWQHLHWLNDNAPVRINGSGDDLKAAEYFAERFNHYGLEADVDHFRTYRSIPNRGSLRLLSPVVSDVRCEACGHIASTPDKGFEAELVNVGYGDHRDYSAANVEGAVVLADITSGPARPEKARIAAHNSAAGIIFTNMGPPEHENIPMGAIKSIWGNPTRASFKEIPSIPAVGITRKDGDILRRYCEQGKVYIHMVAQATQDWGTLPQSRARLRGGANTTGDVIVVAGHFDAWEPGMSDNAAGNALILELARAFSNHKESLRRDIIFGMWNGHEIGEIAGSTWFVDKNWDELDEHGIAYFNIDSVGFSGTSFFETASSTELVRFHQAVERKVLGEPASRKKLTRSNEQPFFPIGIPAMEGSFRFSDEQIAAWDNASGGWWWHSTADTLDKVDQERFRQTYQLNAGYIHTMATSPVLPMDYQAVGVDLAERISAVMCEAGHAFPLDLPIETFQNAADRLDAAIADINSDSDAHRLNRVIKRLGRILTPAFETLGGRYEQDRVAQPALKSPLPLLHDLPEFLRSPSESNQYNLLSTELLRGRNRMADALRRATETIEHVC